LHTDRSIVDGARAVLSAQPPAEAEAIRPFRVKVPDEVLADLRRRILATRWPERETCH
jgi:hypothetical protein